MIIYERLTNDLIQAKEAAIKVAKGDDGGTVNLDCMTLSIPRAREAKVLEAVKASGLYCRGKRHWIGPRYFIGPPGCDQGNARVRQVQAMAEVMRQAGWDVLVYEKAD
jgi:hypothetical protein